MIWILASQAEFFFSFLFHGSPSAFRGWSHGTTVTCAPLSHKQRIWLYLMPQSTTRILTSPSRLKTLGSCRKRTHIRFCTMPQKIDKYQINYTAYDFHKQFIHNLLSETRLSPSSECQDCRMECCLPVFLPRPVSQAWYPFPGSFWSMRECQLLFFFPPHTQKNAFKIST